MRRYMKRSQYLAARVFRVTAGTLSGNYMWVVGGGCPE